MVDIAVTPANLVATVKGLKGPAQLSLAPGDYSKVRISPTTPLIITSADPENRARFVAGLTLDKPLNVSFIGVDFDISSATAEFADAVRIGGGAHVEFDRCGFSGLEREDGERWGRGLNAMGVSDLTVRKCSFGRLHRGVVASLCDDLSVEASDFLDMGSDGVNLGQVVRAAVRYNLFKGFKPSGGDHPDGVQVMTGASGAASVDVDISFNCVVCGDEGVQGIFVRAENAAVRHRNVGVVGNALLGAGLNAISVGSTDNALVQGNACLFVPRPGAKQSNLRAENTNGDVSGNKAMGFIPTSWGQQGGNEVIGAATKEQIAAAEAAWMAKYRAPPAPPKPVDQVVASYVVDGVTFDIVRRAAA